MIVEDMRNTGVLGNPEEWFVPWDPRKTDVDWISQLPALKKRATDETGTCSIKVMANQLGSVDRCLSGESEADPQFSSFYMYFSNAKWVFIRRRDVVAQAVSRLMARQTGINHATQSEGDEHFAGNLMKGYKSDYNANTKYKYDQIFAEVNAIILENLVWNRFFAVHDIDPMVLEYETVSKDPAMNHVSTIGRLIGVDSPAKKERSMVKVGNQKNKDWIDQFYREIVGKNFRA